MSGPELDDIDRQDSANGQAGTDGLVLAPTPSSPLVGSRRPAATLALPAPSVASEDRVVPPKPAAENDEHAVVSARMEQDDAAAGQQRKAAT